MIIPSAIITDFDGVLTDGKVHINEDGKESVICSRLDGLAFDALRKRKIPVFILTTEMNNVVESRAKKLQVPCIKGIGDKKETLLNLCKSNNFSLIDVVYIGDDINDYEAMKLCGYKACPLQSHEKIIEIVDYHLLRFGGDGAFRELIEEKLGLMDDYCNR